MTQVPHIVVVDEVCAVATAAFVLIGRVLRQHALATLAPDTDFAAGEVDGGNVEAG